MYVFSIPIQQQKFKIIPIYNLASFEFITQSPFIGQYWVWGTVFPELVKLTGVSVLSF